MILQLDGYLSTLAGVRPCHCYVATVLLLAASSTAFGAEDVSKAPSGHHSAMEHTAMHAGQAREHDAHVQIVELQDEVDLHAHHRQMMSNKNYSRSLHDYRLPDLPLIDASGEKTSLLAVVNAKEPVMLNFIFTTCTTICPVLSASFTQVQQRLGTESDQVRMVSITIDPEHDTPERLRVYAERYHAGPQWQFLTGSLDDIVNIQKAFDAFRGTKANHEPLTFLRATPESPWVRVNGLASASDIVKEYRQLLETREADR